MASFTAAGTAYATRGVPMVPFFIFYSMFGFQRVGDLIWAAADAQAKGFLLGATAGRTTLLGEGLQHQDGHSLVLASTVPDRARPTTRPSPTRWRPSSATACTACTAAPTAGHAGAGESVFYYLTALQRELRDAGRGPTASPTTTSSSGLYRWAPAPDGLEADGHDPVLGHRPTWRPAPPRPRWPSTTASASSCGAPRPTSACARTPCRRRALEPPAPRWTSPRRRR